ncbi:hypothetical protein [Streptomyces canus]|uniref:hypothetical protein n=1 Tax=Streptomyces canus TaxID=58343 RepID=UPI0027809E94|nr:hypothetical protein [Streptomyces canus]MDQ1073407.1 hypothetical protein [Streptomyces canus]
MDDTSALFASDAVPTGWMGADLGGVGPGEVVAVRGLAPSPGWRHVPRCCSARNG